MLRTVSDQPMLWESVIPECLMGLPGGLAEIDELLDDPRFSEVRIDRKGLRREAHKGSRGVDVGRKPAVSQLSSVAPASRGSPATR